MTSKKNMGVRGSSSVLDVPGVKAKAYTSFVSQVDVVADSPSAHDPCRWFYVTSVGTGTVEFIDASGNTVSMTVGAEAIGVKWEIAVRAFTTSTNVAEIIAVW